jgi:small GTP-binding protein
MSDDTDREVKVVLLGEQAVGKSSIVLRFAADKFDEDLEPTLGAAFLSKNINVRETPVRFKIWDTAGQEKYRSLAPMYYRHAAAAIIVYDTTVAATFEKAKSWVKELQRRCGDEVIIVLAGNKCDMEASRQVSKREAEEYAASIKAVFAETSAKLNIGISEIFVRISDLLPEAAVPEVGDAHDDYVRPGREERQGKKGSGCPC